MVGRLEVVAVFVRCQNVVPLVWRSGSVEGSSGPVGRSRLPSSPPRSRHAESAALPPMATAALENSRREMPRSFVFSGIIAIFQPIH
jgi:hypothetical protein